jgi:hypothetical protein
LLWQLALAKNVRLGVLLFANAAEVHGIVSNHIFHQKNIADRVIDVDNTLQRRTGAPESRLAGS